MKSDFMLTTNQGKVPITCGLDQPPSQMNSLWFRASLKMLMERTLREPKN